MRGLKVGEKKPLLWGGRGKPPNPSPYEEKGAARKAQVTHGFRRKASGNGPVHFKRGDDGGRPVVGGWG